MAANPQSGGAAAPSIEGTSYELIRNRLIESARALGVATDALNQRRTEVFGGSELTVVGAGRIRTENNCVPRDIVSVGRRLFVGYGVYIGLKSETRVEDVFSLHELGEDSEGFSFERVADGGGVDFLGNAVFRRDFDELFAYYKDAKLLQLIRREGILLAVFKIGAGPRDVKVLRWRVDSDGRPSYVDNRGERDFTFAPSHDFAWTPTTRDDQVGGKHPHVNILDEIFVECVGGDLTVKVENNTQSGQGIYTEPVEIASQTLDDGQIEYARLGSLILLRILPYRETVWRHLVYNTRTKSVARIDGIGRSCVQLPEDHGIIFPGGYYLQSGDYKVFDGIDEGLEFKRSVRSPNGEDVLYVFHERGRGNYVLFPYNLVRREVQNPIQCHGYSLFANGRMVVFKVLTNEPTRVHPMQVWQTPFVSAEHAAVAPASGSYLAKVGNAELVRGISDAYSIARLIQDQKPTRQVYEDLIAATQRALDGYYWLGHGEVGLVEILRGIRATAELIIDEFEKVETIRQRAVAAVKQASEAQQALVRTLRPDRWDSVGPFMDALASLRSQRGHLITLRDLRYVDRPALDALEAEVVAQFERVSAACVEFLLDPAALEPIVRSLDELLGRIEAVEKATELGPLREELDRVNAGLDVLAEVISGLEIDDATLRTRILDGLSERMAHQNRVRATLQGREKSLRGSEGRAEFGVQFKLFGQSVTSALALADTPERADEQLSRLLVQLEEMESRFGELDEFLAELTSKREEVYETFAARKQALLDDRQRRIQNLIGAAERILVGLQRRGASFGDDDTLNAFFASDPMVQKVRQIAAQLAELGDTVKGDEVEARLKATRQEALRRLRDRSELFEEGGSLIKLGAHSFSVNNQALELTMVPRGEGMALHLTGTDFYEPLDDPAFEATRPYWDQRLVSETDAVYRAEYLAATLLFAAEAGRDGLSVAALQQRALDEKALLELVREAATQRYDEGYERGVHDHDAGLILRALLSLRQTAELLRFAGDLRARARLCWAFLGDEGRRTAWQRRARSLGRLRKTFAQSEELAAFAATLGEGIAAFCVAEALPFAGAGGDGVGADGASVDLAGAYLLEELTAERPRFVLSGAAESLRAAFLAHLDREGARRELDRDLSEAVPSGGGGARVAIGDAFALARAWVRAYVDAGAAGLDPSVVVGPEVLDEVAAHLVIGSRQDVEVSHAASAARVTGLLGQHGRVVDGAMELRLDEVTRRLGRFVEERVPGFHAYRKLRSALLERERTRLRVNEYLPRVMTSFVRNRLINDVYLPIIGDNLAKQIGAAGEKKRTDLMGLLLLISPPGYGKTTLMEYVASQLGLVFMKVNGPALGHDVHSLDPEEAPNATARQEVEKINLALEMGNNVMLYLDDIQHTHAELLQKFISLCDAQRRIEGVWRGRTRTYDMRGKKFCVVMAGNPYTESGESFRIPDMLANRADIYNLGDILEGKGEQFALSYIENSLTSNTALAPLAGRDPADVMRFVRMARGEAVPATELSHDYSAVEIAEITSVLNKLFRVQEVVLKVNQQYIASASQADAYRTEPPFLLQGSYRNMNKLAAKVVSVMNDQELEALIGDHYVGEAQTLTTGAEQNLLKLAQLRGAMTAAQQARWNEICQDFARIKVMGGSEDDPVTRVTGQLHSLGEKLGAIRAAINTAVHSARRVETTTSAPPPAPPAPAFDLSVIEAPLARLHEALSALRTPQLDLALKLEAPAELDALLARHMAAIEQVLAPLVETTTRNVEDGLALSRHVAELIKVLRLENSVE
jgi:hypothetical protein